ncbi:hypothetical protein, partial [uncultured Bilophila sp.]|uniref:hypothetical protein n=1 Tax=uncultured Bilophila sp. TaxID=529385 RepID=UPI0026705F8B
RLCYRLWLFYLHSAVKIQPFSPVFPLAGFTDKAFCRLSLWNFKEKVLTIFYNTAFLFCGAWHRFVWLCHRKWLMLYFLKFQRNSE